MKMSLDKGKMYLDFARSFKEATHGLVCQRSVLNEYKSLKVLENHRLCSHHNQRSQNSAINNGV